MLRSEINLTNLSGLGNVSDIVVFTGVLLQVVFNTLTAGLRIYRT